MSAYAAPMSRFWNPCTAGVDRRRNRRAVRLKNQLRLILVAGVAAGLALNQADRWIAFGSGEASAAASRQGAASVRVIDGDTFVQGGTKIRIADIDTPELRGRCPYERALALRASRRLDRLLAAGSFELHRVGRDEDRYGRKLRIVTRNGQSLGDMLVAEGLARTWTGRRMPWCPGSEGA